MKNAIWAAVSAFAVLSCFAAERVPLWPEGKIPDFQSRQVAAPHSETLKPGFEPAANRMPYLVWQDPPAASNAHGGVILLIPGGGYVGCMSEKLVALWTKRFTEDGFQCVRLVYRTPRPEGIPYYKSALQDAQRAVRLVRSEVGRRGLDNTRVGAIGMSAGAHLTMMLATSSLTPAYEPVDAIDEIPCRINFAIPCALPYGLAGVPSRTDEVIPGLTDEFAFDANTPPVCLLQGGCDNFGVEHSTRAYRELRKRKIPSELHLYANGTHVNFWDRDWYASVSGFIRQRNLDKRRGELVPIEKRWSDGAAGVVCERQALWPQGKTPDFLKSQCEPCLEWWVPTNLTTKAIQIIHSGGGYRDNQPDKWDGVPAARAFLNQKGMAVVVFRYRTPNNDRATKHVRPCQDIQRCVRLVRQGAAAHGLDPDRIGVWGGSAGGHLALMAATCSLSNTYARVDAADDLSCSVQWAVATYPAYVLTDGVDGTNATGGNEDSAKLVKELAFDKASCPVLFLHGDTDGFAAMGSVKCWEKLHRMGIEGDLHTFTGGLHCFMLLTSEGTGSWNWLDRVWSFLTYKGFNR